MSKLATKNGQSYLYFLQNFGLKFLKPSQTYKNHSDGPKNPEIIQKLSILDFPFWRDHRKTCFSAPKGAISAKSTKSAWDSVTQRVWVYREKFNIDFWFQNVFLTSQHVLGLPKKNWEKNPMLNFSGWPRKLGSPFNWDSQKWSKMRHIIKFRPRGTPYGKSGHLTP